MNAHFVDDGGPRRPFEGQRVHAAMGAAMDATMRAVCALVPACLAASRAVNVPAAADDGGVLRVLSLAPGAFRGLDAYVGSLAMALPAGTRAERAALGGALALALAGVTLYAVVRGLLRSCAGTKADTEAGTKTVGSVVAAIATTTPLVALPWQTESVAVGGSVTGALLVILVVAATHRAAQASAETNRGAWLAAFAALGLAASEDPASLVVAACGFAAMIATCPDARASLRSIVVSSGASSGVLPLVAAFGAGFLPFVVGLTRARLAGVPLGEAVTGGVLGEAGAMHGALGDAARDHVGPFVLVLAAAGLALSLLVPRARPLAAACVALVTVGAMAAWAGSPVGRVRFGAPFLVAEAAAFALAGVAMQALVRAVAGARIPFARGSAAMIVVLELVLPVDAADDTLARSSTRANASSAWDDAAFGGLAPNSLLLADDPRVRARLRAARAEGELRGDIVAMATIEGGPLGWRSLAARSNGRDPSTTTLLPLLRDIALTGAPAEASLSGIALERPVAMAYETQWGNAIGRHLTPLTLFDRFEPEPRGASDRKRAFDAGGAERERLAAETAGDAELAAASATLLRARLAAANAQGDHDLAARTLLDLRAFAP